METYRRCGHCGEVSLYPVQLTLGLVVLAAYALVFGFLAKRFFRWE
jgi:hypothetical protein